MQVITMPHPFSALKPIPLLRPANPLRRMQWQLTLSYMLVTVVVTLAFELILLLLWTYALYSDSSVFKDTVSEIRQEAGMSIQLLRRKPYPLEDLRRLLDNETTPRNTRTDLSFNIDLRIGNDLLCLADPQGNVLVTQTVPGRLPLTFGTPLATVLPAEEQELLTHAMRNETEPNRLSLRTQNGALSFAVPVRDTESGNVLAIVYTRSAPLREVPFALAVILMPQAIVSAVFSCLVGLIVGAVAARRLTERVGGIALAADSWAGGDMTATAPDTGGDELALLARRLNRMAHDLNDLFALRRDVAMVEERHRLARDLHDTVKQQVFAASLQIATARTLAAQDRAECLPPLAEAEALIQQAQSELTDLLRELRPLPGDNKTLAGRLGREIADWTRRTGIKTEFLGSESFVLPESHATQCLRILQEAMANVARHSGATEARIFLNHDRVSRIVTLSLSDNGRGFDPDAPPSGMGLATMRERAEGLPQGGFALQSTIGTGTRIEVRFAAPPVMENTD